MVTTVAFEVVSNEEIAPKVNHIRLKRADDSKFNFIPGQFITIHFEKDGRLLRRSYSIASIPTIDETIDFAASYVENGAASQYLFALQPGDVIQASGPFGRLILSEEALPRLFLLATGTGITPYRAMLPLLSERLRHQADFQVYIMQGVQYRKDALYANDFLHWAAKFPKQIHYRTYLSREDLSENRASYEYSGYVQSSFDELTLVPEMEVVYLCGNPNMIDQAFVKLQNLGLTTRQIRREKYISSK
jgi:ferredoxin-NADP reductase